MISFNQKRPGDVRKVTDSDQEFHLGTRPRAWFSFLLFCCTLCLIASCALFKKAERNTRSTIPPPKSSKPLPPKAEKKVRAAPFNVPAFAKVVRKPVYSVALFAPLYTDQVVNTGFDVNSGQPLPPNALPGLELFEGASMALDSLRKEGIAVRLRLYDTKSTSLPVSRVLQSRQMDSVDLILGAVSQDELKEIGEVARKKEINFVSVTYPNDGGVTENPFLTIVNSTLRTHCYAILEFAQQKFSNQQIIVFRRDNAQEKRNADYIREASERLKLGRKVPVQIVEWDDHTTVSQLASHLSKDKNNVVIVTALYGKVATDIIARLAGLDSAFTLNVIGMPTLDAQKALLQSRFKGLNIYYSTPYFNPKTNVASRNFILKFYRQYLARPSDMAFKGFEALYYFGHLLHDDGVYFNRDINNNSGYFMTRYDFQPVYKEEGETAVPDYFENKYLYFIQIRDSVISRAN